MTTFLWPKKIAPSALCLDERYLDLACPHNFLASWIPATTLKNSLSWLGGPEYIASHLALNSKQLVISVFPGLTVVV